MKWLSVMLFNDINGEWLEPILRPGLQTTKWLRGAVGVLMRTCISNTCTSSKHYDHPSAMFNTISCMFFHLSGM